MEDETSRLREAVEDAEGALRSCWPDLRPPTRPVDVEALRTVDNVDDLADGLNVPDALAVLAGAVGGAIAIEPDDLIGSGDAREHLRRRWDEWQRWGVDADLLGRHDEIPRGVDEVVDTVADPTARLEAASRFTLVNATAAAMEFIAAYHEADRSR